MLLSSKGSPTSQCWVICEKPYANDLAKGYLYSSGMGFVFDKMMKDAGISDYYVTCRRPDTEHLDAYAILENNLNTYKPPIIITLEEAGKFLCPVLTPKPKKGAVGDDDSEISKYCGSLLTSKLLNYPHYIIPTYSPDSIVADWSLRDIVTSLDLGKAKSELDYFRANGRLEPLPERTLKYEMEFDEVLWNLDNFRTASLLSNDIETVYPHAKSIFKPHPGYPITIGLAPSKSYGISFNLFWPTLAQTVKLWKILDRLLWEIPSLGQNFFNFDSCFYDALGFRIDLSRVKDTLLRHHILWPELSHKLQFQTRQYTREPFYKDEGKRWSMKDMKGLRRYNCLDVCCTFEIFEEQEKEFNERPYLR